MHDSPSSKNDVVLFHSNGEYYLKVMVLNNIEYTVFKPELEVKYSTRLVFDALISHMRKSPKVFFRCILSFKKIKSIIRRQRAIYIVDRLKKLKPKIILTFNDNSPLFHQVCQYYPEVPFLAIQNGGRHSWCATNALPDSEAKYNINEYFCFGAYVRDLFENTQHNISKYIMCGSLVGGYFIYNYKYLFNEKKIYDICIVSQWGEGLLDIKSLPDEWGRLEEAINVMVKFVSMYSSENNLKVCVALRSNRESEKMFYEKYFNGRCVFSKCNRLEFSSYKAAVSSELIIAINSTLASEMFGMGRKVLFLNPFAEKWLKPSPTAGIWYLPDSSYEKFYDRVSLLLFMKYKDYIKEAKTEMEYTMSYGDVPAHILVSERIKNILNS